MTFFQKKKDNKKKKEEDIPSLGDIYEKIQKDKKVWRVRILDTYIYVTLQEAEALSEIRSTSKFCRLKSGAKIKGTDITSPVQQDMQLVETLVEKEKNKLEALPPLKYDKHKAIRNMIKGYIKGYKEIWEGKESPITHKKCSLKRAMKEDKRMKWILNKYNLNAFFKKEI